MRRKVMFGANTQSHAMNTESQILEEVDEYYNYVGLEIKLNKNHEDEIKRYTNNQCIQYALTYAERFPPNMLETKSFITNEHVHEWPMDGKRGS